MKKFIINSFVSKYGGGNKAAVVFDDIGLSNTQMLQLAKKNNFSETAFIDMNNSIGDRFCIRYFTPGEEVDICGHAALASFRVLKQLGYLKSGMAYHITKAGELRVIIQEDIIMIEMKSPEIITQVTKEDVLKMIEIQEKDIVLDINEKIDVISTGLKDILLEVKGIETLKNIVIKKEEMISICKACGIIGVHVVSRETIEDDSDFCTRNFAPAVGIDEESATGTSNASMLYYVLKNSRDFDYEKIYKVEQGYFMDSPSNIFVKIDKISGSIFVGGVAEIESAEEL